jgi:hypothetical protein
MAAMGVAILWFVLAALGCAQNPLARPDPFAGRFQNDQVTLELTGARGQYSGWLTVQGRRLPVTVKAAAETATGSFEVSGQTYSFTLTPVPAGLKLASEGAEYTLARAGSDPANPAQLETSIVGSWRNASGSARFNADGTGVVNGEAGTYKIHGDQLTLIGAQGRITLPFQVRGDTLTVTVNGAAVALNRVREEAGPGRIRPEMVGKWCWVSVVNAQQGACTSNQCFTLNADGSYQYSGETDSYNPYGGATSQSDDAGTWTATETTLTAHSRTHGSIVYTLEKRDHPKTGDPMLVLNGQTFVTYYKHAPW